MSVNITFAGDNGTAWVGNTPGEHTVAITALDGVFNVFADTARPVYSFVFDPRKDQATLRAAIQALDE